MIIEYESFHTSQYTKKLRNHTPRRRRKIEQLDFGLDLITIGDGDKNRKYFLSV